MHIMTQLPMWAYALGFASVVFLVGILTAVQRSNAGSADSHRRLELAGRQGWSAAPIPLR
jgi:hypothetical protein